MKMGPGVAALHALGLCRPMTDSKIYDGTELLWVPHFKMKWLNRPNSHKNKTEEPAYDCITHLSNLPEYSRSKQTTEILTRPKNKDQPGLI